VRVRAGRQKPSGDLSYKLGLQGGATERVRHPTRNTGAWGTHKFNSKPKLG
jgi:hypothetical protein